MISHNKTFLLHRPSSKYVFGSSREGIGLFQTLVEAGERGLRLDRGARHRHLKHLNHYQSASHK